jgi:hypothetical protein
LRQQIELRWHVLALYDSNGRRRSKESMKREGYRAGYILISRVDPETAPGRATSCAAIGSIHPAHTRPYFGDLYNPVAVSMDQHRMVLRGYQVGREGALTEQVWVAKRFNT